MLSNYSLQKCPPSSKILNVKLPIRDIDWNLLRGLGEERVRVRVVQGGNMIQSTWIGHASLLVQMGCWNILTDIRLEIMSVGI